MDEPKIVIESYSMNSDDEIYDLIVIGGGIAGAGIARDAVLRGCKTVLFEKNTYGSGTSSKSSKLIHGGIRYLETAKDHFLSGHFREGFKNFFFVFKALRETRILEQTCGGLVKPLTLTIPIYQKSLLSVWGVYFGALLYSLMSILAGNFKAPKLLLTSKAVLRRLSNLNPEGLKGGVVIWDHTTDDRSLVEAIVSSSLKAGLQSYENTPVQTYEQKDSYHEVTVLLEGEQKIFKSRKVVNASGAWVDHLRKINGERDRDFIVPIAGSHIHLKKFTEDSMVLRADDNRTFFVIHRGDQVRIGTTERKHTDPDRVEASPEEIQYLLKSLNQYFPAMHFSEKDILSSDAGIRPLAKPKHDFKAHKISREHEIRRGPTGVLHILGVKLTDHRRAAEEVMDLIVRDLNKNGGKFSLKSVTAKQNLESLPHFLSPGGED